MDRRFHILLAAAALITVGMPLGWMALGRSEAPVSEPQRIAGASLQVASLNIAMVTDVDRIREEWNRVPAIRDADLLLLQEVVGTGDESVAGQLAKKLDRRVAFASPDEKSTVGGIAILSRTALTNVHVRRLKAANLLFRSRRRIALAGTADTPLGAVRIVTTHLDTRVNPTERLAQLEPSLEEARTSGLPGIIGGDFNTNDMQWLSNVVPVPFPGWQASRVRALMASRGFQTPFTERHATFDHLGMQLDWIYSDSVKPVAFGIVPMAFSDHHAVWVQYTR